MALTASFGSCDLTHTLWYEKLTTEAAHRPNRVDFENASKKR